jgi:hypothetical protein
MTRLHLAPIRSLNSNRLKIEPENNVVPSMIIGVVQRRRVRYAVFCEMASSATPFKIRYWDASVQVAALSFKRGASAWAPNAPALIPVAAVKRREGQAVQYLPAEKQPRVWLNSGGKKETLTEQSAGFPC